MKRIRSIVGIGFILIGVSLYLYNVVINRKNDYLEKNRLSNTLDYVVGYKDNDDKYEAVLSIPKIKLKKGIYDINNINNDIDRNIMLDKHSVYPMTKSGSNIILIAHSGIGKIAYFEKLNKLDTDSIVEFYYDHTKYIYKIDNFYFIEKLGKANLRYDKNKDAITLITCSDKDRQLVYIGYLIDKVEY